MEKQARGFPAVRVAIIVVAMLGTLLALHFVGAFLTRAKPTALRTTCAANMGGIGKGLHTYPAMATKECQFRPICLPRNLAEEL
jgi:hypothetical protein